MENEIGKNKKFVSKVLATVLALAMLLPIGLMITVGENPETPEVQQSIHINDFYKANPQIKLANARFDINVGPQGLAPELTIDEYGSRVDGWPSGTDLPGTNCAASASLARSFAKSSAAIMSIRCQAAPRSLESTSDPSRRLIRRTCRTNHRYCAFPGAVNAGLHSDSAK